MFLIIFTYFWPFPAKYVPIQCVPKTPKRVPVCAQMPYRVPKPPESCGISISQPWRLRNGQKMGENGLKKAIIGPTGQTVKVTEKPIWRAERGQNSDAKNGLIFYFSTSMSKMSPIILPGQFVRIFFKRNGHQWLFYTVPYITILSVVYLNR